MRAVIVMLTVALGATLFACEKEQSQCVFHGVRLGMTARDVRDRFDEGSLGEWRVTPGEEMALDWAPVFTGDGGRPNDADTVARARFEFHSGMLVAVRADLDERDLTASGGALSISPASVLARKSNGKYVSYTLLARDCPTHREEEKRLIAPSATLVTPSER